MKHIYNKIILILILFSSLGTIGAIHIEKPDSIELLDEGPEAAAMSANLAAWIVIAGDRSDHDKLSYIRNGCDEVFEALTNRGFSASDIYYLDPWFSTVSNPLSLNRDANSTKAKIKYAIKKWDAGKDDSYHG